MQKNDSEESRKFLTQKHKEIELLKREIEEL